MELTNSRRPTDLNDDVSGKNCDSQVSGVPKKLTKRQKRIPKNADKKLKKEFEKVAQQNESLTNLIKKKNMEIATLKHSSDSLHNILDMIPGDGLHLSPAVANQKLVEVNNKNRRLTVELISAKSQLNKKELQLKQKDMSLRSLENRLQRNLILDVSKLNVRMGKGHTNNVDKLVQALRLDNIELEENLKSALECLQKETGHKWDLGDFLSNSSNWEGRARKIKNLESQISQYNEQIESYKRLLNMESSNNGNNSVKSSEYLTNPAEEIIKCARIKTLENENAALRKELEKQKSNALNMRVRNESLNEEVLQCRATIFSMQKNTGNNKNNFDSLRDTMVQKQKELEDRLSEKDNDIKILKEQLEEAKAKENEAKNKLDAAQKLSRENSERMEKILQENQELESHLKSYYGGFLFSCRSFHKDEFLNIIDGLEAENSQLSQNFSLLERKFKKESLRNEYLKEKLSDQEILIEELQNQLEELRNLKTDRVSKKRSIANLDRLDMESIDCAG